MNDNLPDKTVVLIILATLILIFSLILFTVPNNQNKQPALQWRDYPNLNNDTLQTEATI